MDSLDHVVRDWLDGLEVAGRSPRTIREHRTYARRMGRWLDAETIAWRSTTTRDLARLLATVKARGPALRANFVSSLRCFWAYAATNGYVAQSPAAGLPYPKRPHPLPRALSRDQIRRLLAYLAEQPGRTARRAEAVVIVLLYTGMRCCEAAPLDWADLDIAGEAIAIRDGKTGGRTVALHPVVADVLSRWRKVQQRGGAGPIFSLDGRPIVPARIGKIVSALSAPLGFVVQAHALRHSAATHAIRRGAGLYNVSRMLGHASTATTSRIYLRLDPTDSASAVAALPARDGW